MSTIATESKFSLPRASGRNERIILGVDEAGYGPNLGPLIIAGSAWRVSESLSETEMTRVMADHFCTKTWCEQCAHVPLGDSKQLYSPGSGLRTLEAGLLAMLRQLPKIHAIFGSGNSAPTVPTFTQLLDRLVFDMPAATEPEPLLVEAKVPRASNFRDHAWYGCLPSKLPDNLTLDEINRLADLARQKLFALGIELLDVQALVIDESNFNRAIAKLGSKGRLLSSLTMQLVCQLMAPWSEQSVEIFCDRQGGRKKYSCVLLEAMPDDWFDTLQELDARSSYRRQRAPELRVHFSVGGDSFPPTALASMTAKYLRERLMSSINQYWSEHVAELKPTAGYPNDARRYREQIASAALRLGHDPQDWWRVC